MKLVIDLKEKKIVDKESTDTFTLKVLYITITIYIQ